jgi:hypothetical protein
MMQHGVFFFSTFMWKLTAIKVWSDVFNGLISWISTSDRENNCETEYDRQNMIKKRGSFRSLQRQAHASKQRNFIQENMDAMPFSSRAFPDFIFVLAFRTSVIVTGCILFPIVNNNLDSPSSLKKRTFYTSVKERQRSHYTRKLSWNYSYQELL